MSKKIVVVNAGPRRGWNTDTLLLEATSGAQDAGASVQKFRSSWPLFVVRKDVE